MKKLPWLFCLLLFVALAGCDSESAADVSAAEKPGGGGRPGSGGGRPGGPGGFGGPAQSTAIPVDVVAVIRRDISDYLETNGVLEAENEVDIVARTAGPIVELLVEEGTAVKTGQLLARIDAAELRAQLGIAKVNLEEARVALNRAKVSLENELISQETFDQVKARYDVAAAQIEGNEIQLGYTEIRAPFAGLIIERAIKFAEYVNNGATLFRVSDFDPLLCPIQIPEKDLARVRVGQPAKVTVDSYPGEFFAASVLRVNPVIDRTNGTVKVTLSVRGQDRLRPGMFASVYLQTDVHQNALVVPKEALVLESIGDSLYVVVGDVVSRREVKVGYAETDAVEILEGVKEGERVVVIGQDALTNGTPVYVLADSTAGPSGQSGPGRREGGGPGPQSANPEMPAGPGTPDGPGPGPSPTAESSEPAPGAGPPAGGRGGFRDIDWNDAAQVERMKGFLRQRGLTEEQIEQRIEQMKSGNFQPPARGRAGGPPGGGPPGGGPPSGANGSGSR